MPLTSITNMPIVIKLSGYLTDIKNTGKQISFSRKMSVTKNTIDVEMLIEEDDVNSPNSQQYNNHNKYSNIFIRNIALSLSALLFVSILTLIVVTSAPSQPHADALTDALTDILPTKQEKFELIHGRLKDLSICLTLFNITDHNGACLVHQGKTFDEGQRLCSEHNMTLLEINSSEERAVVTKETMKIFGSGGGTRIWINGKFSSKVNGWLAVPRDETFYLTQEHIEQKFYGAAPSDGDCLAIESWHREKYHVSAVSCSGRSYFYCEF